jgi:heterodisulfide reductase subunit A-like polyferredoxin
MSNRKIEIKRIALNQSVLVIGGGIAGMHAARQIHNWGYNTTLVESSEKLGGLAHYSYGFDNNFEQALNGVEIITEAQLDELQGNVGSFCAQIKTPGGEKTIEAGAVVICSGNRFNNTSGIIDAARILSLPQLAQLVPDCAAKDTRIPIGIILDMKVEETKASCEMAFKLAMDWGEQYACEVYVFCREIRVSSLQLEKLYAAAREAGVNIIKYDGDIELQAAENEVLVTARDVILGDGVNIACSLVGVSPYGLSSAADLFVADCTGVTTDALGQLQDNNIHLLPELTNRPGIFVAGGCKGQYFIPEILRDAKAVSQSVHSLLSQKYLEVELSHAVVDEEKCALCLTCIRSCPHKAMTINLEKNAAEAIPEACQKCGICVGECPAKAITLPEYSDEILMSQLG